MKLVVNLHKARGVRIGIDLTARDCGRVFVSGMVDFPSVQVRSLLQIGDVLVSVNGVRATSARQASRRIVASGPTLSLLISRDEPLA